MTLVYTTYGIINPTLNQYIYVGQTSNFERRKRAHLRLLKKRPNFKTTNIKTHLYDLLLNEIVPEFIILEECDTEILSLLSETHWVYRLARDKQPLLNRWKIHRKIIKKFNLPG